MTETRKWTKLREELLRRGWKLDPSYCEDPDTLMSPHEAIPLGPSPDEVDWVTSLRTALEHRRERMIFHASEGFEPEGSKGVLADVEELLGVLNECFPKV